MREEMVVYTKINSQYTCTDTIMTVKKEHSGSKTSVQKISSVPTTQKVQLTFSSSNGHDGTSSIVEHNKQIRLVKTQGRLRMLVEQLPDGRKRLHLRGLDTLAIPSELYELTDLDILDITPESKSGLNYTLTRVPADFRLLQNLKCLYLDNNNLVSIPNEIGELQHLEIFTASHNFLTSLPNAMRKLQRLESCHLAHNKLEEMPLCLCYLSKSLLFLDLSSNDLRQLPSSIQHLKQLRTLLLLGNRLRTLPDAICQLTKLETLWLGNNNLKALPKQITDLKELDWHQNWELSSNFEGNPLEDPPLKICRQGMDAIEQYFTKE